MSVTAVRFAGTAASVAGLASGYVMNSDPDDSSIVSGFGFFFLGQLAFGLVMGNRYPVIKTGSIAMGAGGVVGSLLGWLTTRS
uniref:Uncharacterized protein n=1 Tax=uncultured bacterium W5-102b TaxID=1130996 RepID=H9BWL4_9BACT|nr:hypothetical protein [uncultured bacterium W5-102b]